ncbi:MAG: hypothetical protein GKR77_01505 [Legionellales bacterium]|nr:hypothetical protein [Legionellales bacterium]
MNFLSKTFLAMATVCCFSSLAQAAGYYAGCEEESVMLECPFEGLHVTGRYLYVQPTGDQLFSSLNQNATFGDGFFLAFGYHFGNDSDLTANWTFFKSDTKRIVVPEAAALLPDPFSRERVDDRLHSINLEFGQTSHWGEFVEVRFHTDLNYTHISRGRSFFAQQYRYSQRFNGFGPRLGADLNYSIGASGLTLIGQANVGLLFGESRLNGVNTLFGEDGEIIAIGPIRSNTEVVTPVFEWRLGAEYIFELSTGYLSIQGGYQWVSYLQVLQYPNLTQTPGLAQTPALGGTVFGERNNFGYHGFYIGLRWQGEWV